MDWSGSFTSITVGRWATSVDTKPTHQLVWWENKGRPYCHHSMPIDRSPQAYHDGALYGRSRWIKKKRHPSGRLYHGSVLFQPW